MVYVVTTKPKGLFFALSAYLCWALLSLFWKQLANVPSYDVFAYRIVWTFVTMAVYAFLFRKKDKFTLEIKSLVRMKKSLFAIIFASLFIAMNWLVYIYAVGNHQATEASLGYYVMPLVSVLLSVIFLKEKLSKASWLAVLFAGIGVFILLLATGKLPVVTIVIAMTFGSYGLLKKQVNLSSDVSMFVESGIIIPFAVIYLFLNSPSTWFSYSFYEQVLLVLSGIVTATPLLLFAEAIRRAALNQVGFIQYINPSLQLLIAIFVFGEGISRGELLGIGFIWLAVLIFLSAQLFPIKEK